MGLEQFPPKENIFEKVENATDGTVDIPEHPLKPLILHFLKINRSEFLLTDQRFKEDFYQEISIFIFKTEESLKSKGLEVSKLEREDYLNLRKEFDQMVYKFKKNSGLSPTERKKISLFMEKDGEEISLLENTPTPVKRSDHLKETYQEIELLCQKIFATHPLGDKKCFELVKYALNGHNAEEINKLCFKGEKTEKETGELVSDLLNQLKKEASGTKESEGFFSTTGKSDENGFKINKANRGTWEKADDERLKTKKVVDMRGLNKEEIKKRICELLDIPEDNLGKDSRRTHVLRLVKRTMNNGGVLEYYPKYHEKQ